MNQETLNFIQKNADADVRQLALKGTKDTKVDLTFALEQIAENSSVFTFTVTFFILFSLFLLLDICYKFDAWIQKPKHIHDVQFCIILQWV